MKSKCTRMAVILVLICQGLQAQFYETGQSPASIKWRQINTGNFRLIYPESFSGRARELAGLLEEAWELTGVTLDHQPSPIPVIIHNHHARSNGLVVWAPKRMELYPVPPQGIRGGHWLAQLAVHEQRHVVQIDKLNQGPVRILSWFLGEQAVGLSTGRIPEWFYEGDAIVAETTLTSSGRGRTPSFYMPMRALLLSGREIFSYDKYLHGSYRDYVPDSYQYGYQIVSALRREKGPGVWETPIDYTARRPYYLSPFYSAIRAEMGEGMSSVHEKALTGARDEWQSRSEPGNAVTGTGNAATGNAINRRDDELYLNYRYPAWAGDSVVIALKSGIAAINEFVKTDLEGNEESLYYPGILSSPVIATGGNRIAWSEYQPDLRWGLNTHSIIRILDLDGSTQSRRLTFRSRYFSPAFDPGGLFLAVVETGYGNQDRIVLLNSVTGEAAATFDAPTGENLQRPAFSAEGDKILVTSVSREGNSILSIDRETGEWITIREPAFANLSGVFPCGQLVCFHTDITGIDNIFAMDVESGRHYQVTDSRYGAFDGELDPSGGSIVWADYTPGGFDIYLSEFKPDMIEDWEEKEYFRNENLDALIDHEKGLISAETAKDYDTTRVHSRPYRKGLNLFNFHSWSPFYYDYRNLNVEQIPVSPGITLLSQNLLNTASTILGYSYRNGNHVTHGSFIYKGWYPVLEAGFDYGDDPQVLLGRDTIGPPAEGPVGRLNLNGTVSLPLNLTSGRYIAGFAPLLRFNYHNYQYHSEVTDAYEGGMTTIQARLIAYRYSRRSHRDLAPPWGQLLRLQRSASPFEPEILGSITAAELTLYFPGLMPHHSLRLEGALQSQEPQRYYFSNLVMLPRGYPREAVGDLRLLKAGYSFPFLYPDLSFPLPGVIYLKRFHAELFAGGGLVTGLAGNGNRFPENEKVQLFSWGATITTNMHILRAPFPINITTGTAHIPSSNEFSFLINLGVDLGSF